MDYPVNPYNRDSQPLSHYLQEQKNWKTFVDDAFAPINEAYAPKQQPIPGMPFSRQSATPRRAAGPLMTREEVVALLRAPLPATCTPAPLHTRVEDAERLTVATHRICVRIAVAVFVATLTYLQFRGG